MLSPKQFYSIRRRRRKTIRVITLPKSGTYFLIALLTNLKAKKKVSHLVDDDGAPLLEDGAKAVMSIRDPRGFFVSLTHWCDKCAEQILEGEDVPTTVPENASEWLTYDFDDKLKYLITEDDRSVCKTSFILPHFDYVSANLDNPNLYVIRFKDMVAGKDGEPTQKQLDTLQPIFSHFNVDVPKPEIADALKRTHGNSTTFFRGDPYAWREEISDKNMDLLLSNWGNYIEEWGFRR